MKKVLNKEELVFRCVNCGKEIKPLFDEEEYPANPDEINYNYGVVGSIAAGYGSVHDGDLFIVAICDPCVEELVKDKKMTKRGNFLFGD